MLISKLFKRQHETSPNSPVTMLCVGLAKQQRETLPAISEMLGKNL